MLLIEGVFPSSWKSTVVILLPKKKGIEPEFKNFRPISNLPFISKLIEKATLNQISSRLENNGLYDKYNSANRAHYHSTETLLTKIYSDIMNKLDK